MPYIVSVFLYSLLAGIYTQQFEVTLFVLVLYAFGLLFIKYILKPKNNNVIKYYSLFFFIYGLLVLITQIQLIKDPYNDYYVHNDASDAFYTSLMENVMPCSWHDLINRTLLNPLYADYPLASLLFGFLAKIGTVLNVNDMRFFLRLHVILIGSSTISIIACYFSELGYKQKDIRRLVVSFGLFSYLFITSAIFSRDVHICFLYTLFMYYFLSDRPQRHVVPFIIIILLATGCRPSNGAVLGVYLFAFFVTKSKNTITRVIILSALVLLSFAIVTLTPILSYGIEKITHYQDWASLNTTGGLFERVSSLPFPINQILINIYLLCLPLPITAYINGPGMTILNITFCLSPYLMLLVVYVSVKSLFKTIPFKIKTAILISLFGFVLINYVYPDFRRSYAAIPGLYLAYGYVKTKAFSSKDVEFVKSIVWPLIFVVSLGLTFYVLF